MSFRASPALSSALAATQLEDARKDAAEAKQRAKVEAAEAAAAPKSEELTKARKELAFTRQLLKELVSALSRGSVSLPPTADMLAASDKK